MNEKDLQFLERHWKRVPIVVLAEKYSLTPIQLMGLMRKHGIVTEIQPFELEYISKNLDRMPASEIQSALELTSTQFSQIVEKVLGRTRRKRREEMSISDATARTRWLIEEKLGLSINDFLPRKIKTDHFADNDLYDCIRFATSEKAKDSLYRYFPAVAFLVCHAYPQRFRPFQFKHAKRCDYFKGAGGRKNLINAARWVIERKMGHDPESLPVICRSKYFLRNRDLDFFGIGSHWFMQHFSSRKEFIDAILKEYRVVLDPARGKTRDLREVLTRDDRAPKNCEVPGCYYDDEFGLDIHHIIPVSASSRVKLDINDAANLIALCPNHHRIAADFDWRKIDLKTPNSWHDSILEFLASRGENSNQPLSPDNDGRTLF
jgi:hypothetical protein